MNNQTETQLTKYCFLQVSKDKEGREYHNIKFKKQIEAVLCIDGVNKVFFGFPRVVIRKGNSHFGEQVYIQFWIQEKGKEYKDNTQWQNFEFYFTNMEFLEFITIVYNYIKDL